MSHRHDRNRKDSRGKTPQQIHREYPAHEAAYNRAIGGEIPPITISPAGYLRRLELFIDHWPGAGEESPFTPEWNGDIEDSRG